MGIEEIKAKPKYDLEERLIDFSVSILNLVESLPSLKGATHLGSQLMRSGTSPSLNYGEAQSSESNDDFIHKMKVCLKELRESFINLKILERKGYLNLGAAAELISECDQLIRIFRSSILTAENKNKDQK